MTILVGACSREALVLGADSQEANQVVKRATKKLFMPQPGLALAWAGYKDVAQALALSLREQPLNLSGRRSKIAQDANERFNAVRTNPDVEHRSEMNEFMLGWYCRAERKPVALHLQPRGGFVWVEQWHHAGTPTAIATARTVEESVSYIAIEDLGAEQLALVTLKVLRDSIAAAPTAALIGGGAQLATVTSSGVHVLKPEELRAGNDALDVWEEQCAELLPGATVPPRDVAQVDPGLEPPF